MEEYELNKSFTIHDLPSSERPRERLQRLGPESLSAQELIEAVLGMGGTHGSVIILAQGLINRFNDIQGIAEASIEELRQVKGIGLAKACQIKAAFELANRWDKSNQHEEKVIIKTPEEAYGQLKGKCRGQKKEHFWAILLDTRNQVIKSVEISVGSLDTSIVHPREVFKEAIAASSSSMIVNHRILMIASN
jgi:DNA repair protein RadC